MTWGGWTHPHNLLVDDKRHVTQLEGKNLIALRLVGTDAAHAGGLASLEGGTTGQGFVVGSTKIDRFSSGWQTVGVP